MSNIHKWTQAQILNRFRRSDSTSIHQLYDVSPPFSDFTIWITVPETIEIFWRGKLFTPDGTQTSHPRLENKEL